MKHIVMFSGGIGSWMTAKRVIAKHGTADTILLFADVKGEGRCLTCDHRFSLHINGRGPCDVKDDDDKYCGCTSFVDNPFVGEHPDTYRFIDDAAAKLQAELVTVMDPKKRDIWGVYESRRYLGNSRQANCSIELKQKPCLAWLKDNVKPDEGKVYVGIDWTESHRLPAVEAAYAKWGYKAEAPLCNRPYLDKDEMIQAAIADGLTPPSAYAKGYPHNNCSGFCVRAGKSQFKMLLEENREAYMFHEGQELKLREYLGKPVTILTEMNKGEKVNLTLRSFRERQESQKSLFDDDEFDFGGCGCFSQFEDDE